MGEQVMTLVVPVRLPPDLMEKIDEILEERALSGVSRSQVVRELLVQALADRKGKRK